jgi:hypothetical protein
MGVAPVPIQLVAGNSALLTAEGVREGSKTGLLRDSETEFLSLTSGLSESQCTYKPAPDRWSVGETAEHIVLAEGLLFSKLQEAMANPPNTDWEAKTAGKTEFIERVMPDRSHKAQAPEPIQPHEKWTQAETIARYKEVRAPGRSLYATIFRVIFIWILAGLEP